jgi:type II secretory pathway pseudopilin PulG
MERSASTPPSSTLGAKLFTTFLVIAVIALSVLTVLLSRENASLNTRLTEAMERLQVAAQQLKDRATRNAIASGDTVETVELLNASGEVDPLVFGPEEPHTLLLFVQVACGACEDTVPVWEDILSEGWPGLRVACVQVAQTPDAPPEPVSTAFPCRSVSPTTTTWLRRIPVAPSALRLTGRGQVLHTWFGHMSASQATELRAALADVAAS